MTFVTIFDLCGLINLSVLLSLLSISGRQLERVERLVSVHVRVREAAQQRVHSARTQTRWTPLRRGGAGHGQLHGRPVHTEWVSVVTGNSRPLRV